MLSRNFTMFFYLKKRNNYVKGKLPIYIRLTVNGERLEVSTKKDCEPEKWNTQTGRKNGTKEDARILNAYLDTMQFKIFDIHRKFLESGQQMTAQIVKNKINGVADKPKLVLETFQQHNDKLEQLVGTDYALGTPNSLSDNS
jgi:hypothetical protein